jgi:hypothetical protein
MSNVKPKLYMKKMYEEIKDATDGYSGTFWGDEKRESLPLHWLMKTIESFAL